MTIFYFTEVSKFTESYEVNYVMLIVSKTKKISDWFSSETSIFATPGYQGRKGQTCSQYKYLGTVLDSKLNFVQNTALI